MGLNVLRQKEATKLGITVLVSQAIFLCYIIIGDATVLGIPLPIGFLLPVLFIYVGIVCCLSYFFGFGLGKFLLLGKNQIGKKAAFFGLCAICLAIYFFFIREFTSLQPHIRNNFFLLSISLMLLSMVVSFFKRENEQSIIQWSLLKFMSIICLLSIVISAICFDIRIKSSMNSVSRMGFIVSWNTFISKHGVFEITSVGNPVSTQQLNELLNQIKIFGPVDLDITDLFDGKIQELKLLKFPKNVFTLRVQDEIYDELKTDAEWLSRNRHVRLANVPWTFDPHHYHDQGRSGRE